MNDRARNKFITRLSIGQADVSPGDAAFIDALGEAEEFTDAQRRRIDDLRARYEGKRGARKTRAPKPPEMGRDEAQEALMNPCKKCGGRGRLRSVAMNGPLNHWEAWCCTWGGLSGETAGALVALWNLHHPGAAKVSAEDVP